MADLTRTKEVVLTQDVAPLLAARLVPAETAVDVPPSAPLLQRDQALQEKLLTALAIAKCRQAHPKAQEALAASEAALVAASEAALVVAALAAASEVSVA